MREFLLSVILAGIFAAVSELILPARLYGTGRLLKALCAAVIVSLILSPLLSVFLGEGTFVLPEPETESFAADEADAASVEGHITALAFSTLEEAIAERAESVLGEACEVEVFCEDDINRIVACIYSDSDAQMCLTLAERVEADYDVTCRILPREKNDE